MPKRGCRVCFPCPRALSRTANAAEIARSHWLLPCRGVGDGYVQVRRSCSSEECARVFSSFPARVFNQFGQAGDRGKKKREISPGCLSQIGPSDPPIRLYRDSVDCIGGLLNRFIRQWPAFFLSYTRVHRDSRAARRGFNGFGEAGTGI